MVVFNYTGRELSGKIVYYGPALSGKTTNLEQIYAKTPATTRGKMVSMKTKAERTLFFDLLPINRGTIGDFKVRYLLYTVPGQVYYNATRKLVLKGADAIVFVADSQRAQLAANIDSLRNLRTNLLEYGMCLDDLPWVICYNKRDMPDAMSIEELNRELNPYGVPSFVQVAVKNEGVFEAFERVGAMLMERLERQLKGEKGAGKPAASASSSTVDASAVRAVREAIHGTESLAAIPPPVPSPAQPAAAALPLAASAGAGTPAAQQLVIERGFEALQPGSPAASGPAATAAAPLVIEKQLVVPVPAAELRAARNIRLVLNVTIDPQG
jgi:mutual gliding-motility protein MglA